MEDCLTVCYQLPLIVSNINSNYTTIVTEIMPTIPGRENDGQMSLSLEGLCRDSATNEYSKSLCDLTETFSNIYKTVGQAWPDVVYTDLCTQIIPFVQKYKKSVNKYLSDDAVKTRSTVDYLQRTMAGLHQIVSTIHVQQAEDIQKLTGILKFLDTRFLSHEETNVEDFETTFFQVPHQLSILMNQNGLVSPFGIYWLRQSIGDDVEYVKRMYTTSEINLSNQEDLDARPAQDTSVWQTIS